MLRGSVIPTAPSGPGSDATASALEMAHVLFMDVVAYSTLPIEQQCGILSRLQQMVRGTAAFVQAQEHSRLICLPTGDGMALVFFGDPEQPVACALELGQAVRNSQIKLRMGIHTGLVYRVADINTARNVAGGGINMAQRVMDCGDAGHILASKVVADMLAEMSAWNNVVRQDLGEIEVKHGVRLHLYNLHTEDAGNPNLPQKLLTTRKAAAGQRKVRRRRVWASLCIAILFTALSGSYLFWRTPPAAAGQKIMAVLPFDEVGQSSATSALDAGLMETVASKLVEAGNDEMVEIVAPHELRAKGVKNAADARREFGTDLVLEGSLQQSGQELRITCNLVDSRTGRQLGARTVTRDMNDIFNLQDETVRVAWEMLVAAQVAGTRRDTSPTSPETQPAAYEAYIRGRGYLEEYEKPENIEDAVAEFKQAISIDPNYAAAYAGLGRADRIAFVQLLRGNEWIDEATSSCEKALALSPHLAEGHICLGDVLDSKGQYENAAAEFQRAAMANGNSEEALQGLADAYTNLGKFTDAEAAYKKAIDLRPKYWGVYSSLGLFYFNQARYADAVAMFKKSIDLAPENYSGYVHLGGTYVATGHYEDAVTAYKHSLAIVPSQDAYTNLGYTYTLMHRYAEAIDTLEQGLKLSDTDYETWGNLADALYWSPQRRPEAAAKYREAMRIGLTSLRINARDGRLLAYLGYYSAMLGNPATAREYARKAVELAPSDGEALLEVAGTYNQLRDTNDALKYLGKAAQVGYSLAIIRDSPCFGNLKMNTHFRNLPSIT